MQIIIQFVFFKSLFETEAFSSIGKDLACVPSNVCTFYSVVVISPQHIANIALLVTLRCVKKNYKI